MLPMQSTLTAIGWPRTEPLPDPPFEAAILARVIAQHRDQFEIHDGVCVHRARTPASLRKPGVDGSHRPHVGDWVFVEGRGKEAALIREIVPRRTVLRRGAAGDHDATQIIAVNLDCVLIVCGLDGDFNLKRIERYLTLVASSGARPLIVFSKLDRNPEAAALVDDARSRFGAQAPVLALNLKSEDSRTLLLSALQPGETICLVGSSGAGKSTLSNLLLGEERQATQDVREHDSRGRHTTTHRSLLSLSNGACLIDTPGMRELKLQAEDEEAIEQSFEDIEALALQCRFRDCQHAREPGCAIRAALESGQLDSERLANYRKLSQELTDSKARAADRKAQEKVVNKSFGKRLVEKYGRR
ncbi:ribosome small subunit-dependent GTPase A [Ahniella affigens]